MKLNKNSTIHDLFKCMDQTDDLLSYDYEDEEINKFLKSEVFMTGKWTMGCNTPGLLDMFNEYSNPYIFSLGSKHMELFYKINTALRSYDDNPNRRYNWIYPRKKKIK